MAKYIIGWVPLMVIAIANGAAREMLYKNALGDLRAHQVSTLTLILLMLMYGYFARHWLNIQTMQEALKCCFIWVGMTLLFEFGFGHWVAKKPFEELFAQYNLLAGNLWFLVILTTAALPFIIKHFNS